MSEQTHEVEVLPNLEMSECPQDFQVSIQTGFGAFMQQAKELVTKGREIAAQDESPEQEDEARKIRLALVKVRTGAEKLHKEMKAGILTQGRAIDGAKNIVIAVTEPTEKELKIIEDRAERRAEEARLKLHTERKAELNQYTTAFDTISLGRLSDDEYSNMLNGAKLAHEARIEQERKAAEERAAAEAAAKAERERLEAERIERERIAEEERKRIAEENARLKAEADRLAAEREAERKAAAEALAKEQAKAAAAAKAQADALAKERAERERIERERQAEADRLARIEADRIAVEKAEADRKAQADASAALAPDKEKIAAYATALKAVPLPAVSTATGKKAAEKVAKVIETALEEIRTIYKETK